MDKQLISRKTTTSALQMKSWTRISGFALAVLTLSQCATNTKPPSGNVAMPAPEKFHARIGGFFGPSMDVEMESASTVVYRYEKRGFLKDTTAKKRIRVSPEKWAAFRAELDAARAWKWRREYENRGTTDGTSWELEVRYPGQGMKSSGLNAYPSKPEFEQALEAVRNLTGQSFQ